jgi:CO dehydrogenase/acetyl-CoA synthase beta subunit
MAEEFPFDISPMYEGERIRGKDFYVELGGPKNDGYELMQATSMDEVEDGKFTLIGPDIPEIEEGSKMAFAQIYKIAGELVEEELEGVMERRVHDFQNYIQGFMHLNQRYDIWCRISKDDVKKGVNSLKMIADATMMLFHNELPLSRR